MAAVDFLETQCRIELLDGLCGVPLLKGESDRVE